MASTTPFNVSDCLADVLFHNTNHRWAHVVVNAHVPEGFTPNGKSYEDVKSMLTSFIQKLAPQLQPSEVRTVRS